jgi:hypothetical protein
MKSQLKLRKEWEKIAVALGMQNKTVQVATTNSQKLDHMLLVNNFKRFVKGMCALPLAEQEAKLKQFNDKLDELVKEQADAKTRMQESIKDIKIEKKDPDVI